MRDIHEINKKSPQHCSFACEYKEKHLIYMSKNVTKKNMLIYYSWEKKTKDIIFLTETRF